MIKYDINAYVVNHVNLAISKKLQKNCIKFTKKSFSLVKLLHRLGCIHKFLIVFGENKTPEQILFSVFFYKNTSFFKGLRLVSTQSKKFFISLRALKILNTTLKSSTLILSTHKGLITHHEALIFKIGGLIICSLS